MDLRIVAAKNAAINGRDMFLRNFSHVPEEKLNWSPTPTAKTPIRVAAHAALYMSRFAAMISTRELPKVENLEEWLNQRNAEEEAITTRAEIEESFKSGTEEVLNALDNLTDEDVDLTLDSGQGWTMPMTFLMNLPGWHSTLHLGQIDYLQTCWNDQEIYVG